MHERVVAGLLACLAEFEAAGDAKALRYCKRTWPRSSVEHRVAWERWEANHA